MTIHFYAGSGSPYVWRVWLALEHKALPYELHLLSFQAAEHQKPEYLAINPRGKVPAIVDDGFALYESTAILHYLEDRYPSSGKTLFPGDAKARALVHRLLAEADNYVSHAIEKLVGEIFFKPADQRDAGVIAAGRQEFGDELARVESAMAGDFLAGAVPSAADFAVYPFVALTRRMQTKFLASLDADGLLGPKLAAWAKRVEALPYYDKTYPPHWRG